MCLICYHLFLSFKLNNYYKVVLLTYFSNKIYKNHFIISPMKKLGVIISSLLAINFASAATLSEVLGELDQSLVVLIALFLITFALAFFSLNKIFKTNRSMAGIIAAVVAFTAVYGINKIGFNTQDFFYNLGLSESTFALILFIVVVAGIIFMVVSLKRKKDALLILGALLIILSFFVYSKTLLIVVGIILLVIWFFIGRSRSGIPKNPTTHTTSSGY
jgi:hypothetical protein